MIQIEHQFDILSRQISRRGAIRTGALLFTLLVTKLTRPTNIQAQTQDFDPTFDLTLDPKESFKAPNSHFLTVKGDVLIDGVDVKESDDPSLGTIGRVYRQQVQISAPYGANIHGNLNRCEADSYYRDSLEEMRQKGCLSGCSDLKEWSRGNPDDGICLTGTPAPEPTIILPTPTPAPSSAQKICVSESPINPEQSLPTQPKDYEVCAGATVFVPKNSVIQGDVEPMENGSPRVSWHDDINNTGLITITNRNGYWRFPWGGDVYYDPDSQRLEQYAKDSTTLMRSRGCELGCTGGVKIVRWPEEKGQAE